MTAREYSPYDLLKSKAIYEILDGDASFYSSELDEDVKLPHLSGPKLIEILKHFGVAKEYGKESRWTYVQDLLEQCIKTGHVSDMFNYLFSLDQFRDELRRLAKEEACRRHDAIVAAAIDVINGELLYSGHELSRIGNSYAMIPTNASVAMESPSIEKIDLPYVKKISSRAQDDIIKGDYDSALTKARTLLEEAFIHSIEQRGEKPTTSGNMNELFSQAKRLYNMHADKDTDKRICDLVNGLNKIVDSIGQMRNKQSDAHGVGASRVGIDDYHARLVVNSAVSVAEFMLSVANKANRQRK